MEQIFRGAMSFMRCAGWDILLRSVVHVELWTRHLACLFIKVRDISVINSDKNLFVRHVIYGHAKRKTFCILKHIIFFNIFTRKNIHTEKHKYIHRFKGKYSSWNISRNEFLYMSWCIYNTYIHIWTGWIYVMKIRHTRKISLLKLSMNESLPWKISFAIVKEWETSRVL